MSRRLLLIVLLALSLRPALANDTCRKPAGCKRLLELLNAKFPMIESGFTLTEQEFIREAHAAHRQFPELFAKPAIEPVIYRFDQRPPRQIFADGGFWPNPSKPNLELAAHTAVESSGSCNYVSFSWRHNPVLLLANNEPDQFFLPEPAEETVRGKKVYILYEYRIRNVRGVRVIGGDCDDEKEVITRGVDLESHPNVTYRRVFLVTHKSHRLVYGPWSPLTVP